MFKTVTALLKLGLSAAMVYVLGVAALNVAGYQPNPILFMGLALLLCGAMTFAFQKWTRLLIFIGFAVLGFAAYWMVYLKLDTSFIKETIPSYFQWLRDYVTGQTSFEARYGLFLGALLYFIIGSIVVLAERNRIAEIVTLVCGLLYFGYLWFHYIEFSRASALLFTMLGICKYGVIQYEKKIIKLQVNGYSIDEGIYRGLLLTIVITSVICLGIANTIKLRLEPIYFEALNEQVMQSFPFVVELRNEFEESRDYGYENGYEGSGGISKGKHFGEPIIQSDRPVLEVKTSYKKTLYLRGSVYDLYDGTEWKSVSENEHMYNSGDDIGLNEKEPLKTFELVNLSLRHVGLASASAFVPYNTYRIEGVTAKIFSDDRNRIFFSKVIPKRGGYQISAKIPVIQIPEDHTFGLGNKEEIKNKGEIQLQRYINHQILLNNGESTQWEVAEGIETNPLLSKEINGLKYFAMPVGYSEKVKQLTQHILFELPKEKKEDTLKGTLNKVTMLAEYLRSHYEYTLEPPKRPRDKDLVEYFLFQSKKGYCVHFATALVMMLRSEGIPARYVEGFVSEYDGAERRVIRANKAHAWVEVYIDELSGWYTFESTPILSEIIPDQKEASISAIPVNGNEESAGQKSQNNTKVKTNRDPRYNRVETEDDIRTNGTIEGKKERFLLQIQRLMRYLFLSLLGISIVWLGFRIIRNLFVPYIKQKKMWKSKGRNGLDVFFELLCFQTVFLGVRFNKSNTIKEFGERLIEQISGMSFVKNKEAVISLILEGIGLYEKARYGGAELTVEEQKKLTMLLKNLRVIGIERLGKWGFFIRNLQK